MRKLLAEAGTGPPMSRPFWSIWRDPESTVLQIVHENPGYRLLAWPLIASLAFSSVFEATGLHGPDDAPFVGLFWGSLLSFGPVLEIAQLFVGAWVLRVIGAQFGGVASSSDVQVAIAWSNVPIVCLVALQMALWLPFAAVMAAVSDDRVAEAAYTSVTGLLACLELGAIAASVNLLVRGVAAVHNIDWTSALAAVLITWLAALLGLSAVAAALGGSGLAQKLVFGPLAGA